MEYMISPLVRMQRRMTVTGITVRFLEKVISNQHIFLQYMFKGKRKFGLYMEKDCLSKQEMI